MILYTISFLLAILCGILAIHIRLISAEMARTRERLHKLEGCTKVFAKWLHDEPSFSARLARVEERCQLINGR